jgi:type IV secretion system protein VirB4
MIRVNKTDKHTHWFASAGAACSIIPISRFIGPNTFALKSGGYGCLFSLTGVDDEGRTDQELDALLRSIEGALRGLPEGACLYQYTRVMTGFDLPRQAKYDNPVTEEFVKDRLRFLNDNANFRRISLFWCLTLEPPITNVFRKTPRENANENARRVAELQKTAVLLEAHLESSIGLKLLGKQEAFRFFSYLFNLQEWADGLVLRADDSVDRQIVRNPVCWHSDYLRVGKRYVQLFSLTDTPAASRPCLFSGLLALDCEAILSTMWRPKTAESVRKEVTAQEKFTEFFKASVFQRLLAKNNPAELEKTAGAKAATEKVGELSEVIKSLDQKAQGEFSLRLLLAGRSVAELNESIPTVHRLFVDAQAPIVEETIGNLSAFYAMFPGNQQFAVYPLWLREDHHARLSSIFAPHLGHPHSEDLDREYLNVFETRTRTPFFQDVYVDGVRVMLIIGPTGTGKSIHANQMLALEQKYNGFSFVFDIGGSYESNIALYGGRIDRVGIDGPRSNLFSSLPTGANLTFLYSFVKMLLLNGGAELQPEDDDIIGRAIQGIYHLDPENRRLGNLFLPKHLQRYLTKWIGDGVYGSVFDNVDDTLTLARVQCFDFARLNNRQHADLIEPLMVWLLRRIDDVIHDPANLGVPKHIIIEELFANMKNKQLLEAALASIKTVRKNLGGVTLIAQSADDLGSHADSIVNSCSSFLFLPDITYNRSHYADLFNLNSQQLNLFESLRRREALYIRRDGVTKVVTLNLDPSSYAKFSTKPKDRVRRSKLVEAYGLSEGLARFARGDVA